MVGADGRPSIGVNVFRTPDERFARLPGFPYEPRYRLVDGLRLAHVDAGEGAPIVLCTDRPPGRSCGAS
jgi:haloalkane dehalogenase